MVSCKMNMRGICAFFCMMITIVVCDAECDEYIVVFEEITCSSHVKLTPLKRRDINWDKVTYPCNSTDNYSEKKKCVVEFDCLGKEGSCLSHIKKRNHQTHTFIDNVTAKPITSTVEALGVPKSNIAVKEKPHQTVDEEFNNTSTYDVNLIYIKDNVIANSSKTTCENCTLYCDYAEIACIDGGRPENNVLSDVKNKYTLEIAINRDETSLVQPVFTGYFPESSSDSSRNYKNNFKDLKTVSLSCSSLKYNNCKQKIENKSSKQINVYIKTNYIENNTITKYPDCTKHSITPGELDLKCEDILFAKHNPHIVQTPPTLPPKQELSTWHCQLILVLSSEEQGSENNKIHFNNCSSNKIKLSTGDINIDPSSQTNPENIITILISEKASPGSDNSYLNINEGKIIDLDVNNNKEKILKNNKVELILSNRLNINSSTVNGTQPHPEVELSIILKNESLNTSNLKHFNGTPEDVNVKRRILLRCDNSNVDLSSNKTVLQCESIDLDLYHITGIEIIPLSQTSSNKTTIASNNKTKPKMSNWNCQIFELNDTLSPKEQQSEQRKLYFKNCSNDLNINNSKKKFEDNNVTPIYDGKNRTVNSTTTAFETIDSTEDVNKRNKTEILSGKLKLSKDNLSFTNPENMIKIIVTEKENNCSNTSSLNIDEGKIIDLRANNNKMKFLQNNIVELKLSSCIDFNSSINNETQSNSKVELTIILKSESLNDSNLKLFNGTAKMGNVRQRILLRCDHLDLDSNNTVLHCESIDLDLNKITGIQISTNISPTSNPNNTKDTQTKINAEVNENNNFSPKKIVEKNESTVINKRNTEVQKKVPETKDNSKTLNFNRKKDIPNGAGQNSLALGSPETEKILLIALLTVVSVAILIVTALKACPKKREYSPAPTREPPDEEETAF